MPEGVAMDMTSCPDSGAPAEIIDRDVLPSTDGPVEHARLRCVDRHHFFMSVEGLGSAGLVRPPRRSRSGR